MPLSWLPRGADPAARTETLVDLLSRDGFAASARPVRAGALAGVQLCQGHCPVQHAAEQFPTFCEAETDAFSRLLGVHVQRLATAGGRPPRVHHLRPGSRPLAEERGRGGC